MLINKFSRVCGCIALCTTLFSIAIPVAAEIFRDPTRPPSISEIFVDAEQANATTTINITAVLKKNLVSYAVINNSWLQVGEKVGAWRVTEITNSGVFLKNENEPKAKPLRFLVNEKSDFKKQTNNE
jgi:hypothetical protein